jgi:Protein of unknown function (DUF559)
MPTPLTPLPAAFTAAPFSIADATSAGVGRKRLARPDLVRPFAGVRMTTAPADTRDRCSAYLPRMAEREFFSHVTAAVLHEFWLPLELEMRPTIDVSVVRPDRAPRDRNVVGHHLVQRPRLVTMRDGFRVSDPVETWCQLATLLNRRELVVAGEGLLQRGRAGAELMRAKLLDAASDGDRPFSRRLAAAAPSLRAGVRSPGETLLRLLLVEAGLPEPEINTAVTDASGRFIGEGDLVYRGHRVVVEYEGDYHRVDKRQWRKDILRYERMQDAGYRVIRVTVDDLRDRPGETIARVRAALASR